MLPSSSLRLSSLRPVAAAALEEDVDADAVGAGEELFVELFCGRE